MARSKSKQERIRMRHQINHKKRQKILKARVKELKKQKAGATAA